MNVALFSTFSSISPGSADGPDDGMAFTNSINRPILLRDIVFDWDWTVPARTLVKTYGAPLGDALRVQAKIGNHPLTAGYVPIPLVGTISDWRANTPPMTASGDVIHSTFTWAFPRPLWIPPNVALQIQIQHQNDFAVDVNAPATTIDVTARGAVDETGFTPSYVDIPYCAAYLGPVRSTVSGGQTGLLPMVTSQTAQTDLFNPFDVPLAIDRFRYGVTVSSHGYDSGNAVNANFAPTAATSAQDQTSALASGQGYGLDRRYVNIKLTSAVGRSLIKDYLPIGAVISSTNRSLGAGVLLDARRYYIAQIQEQMPLFTDRGTLPFQMRTTLAIVGSRRVPIGSVAYAY